MIIYDDDGIGHKVVPMSVIEDIKAEIEQRIEMFVSAGDFGNAVTVRSILDIIDKHTKGDTDENRN